MKVPQSESWKTALASLEDKGVFDAIRASGPGGQHVNKTSSAVQFSVAIDDLTLPLPVKMRLLQLADHRITPQFDIQIKAQSSRSQKTNKVEALERAKQLLLSVWYAPKHRRVTKPSRSVVKKRAQQKQQHSQKKQSRRERFTP